jgi:hypothetical protein
VRVLRPAHDVCVGKALGSAALREPVELRQGKVSAITCRRKRTRTSGRPPPRGPSPRPHHHKQHNNTPAPPPISSFSRWMLSAPLIYEAWDTLASSPPKLWTIRMRRRVAAPRDRAPSLSTSNCGYATLTDWTVSAPIARHSGYIDTTKTRPIKRPV